jgi:hypothetical protein
MVVADFRPQFQPLEHVGNFRGRDVEPQRHLLVGGSAAVEGGVGEATSQVGEVEIGREGGGEKSLIVAPDLAAPLAASTCRLSRS